MNISPELRNGFQKPVWGREIEYIERASYNTFYPFQNKHQIHQHLESVRKLCAFKNQNLVSNEMG